MYKLQYQKKTLLSRLACWLLQTELHSLDTYRKQRQDERDRARERMLKAERALEASKDWQALINRVVTSATVREEIDRRARTGPIFADEAYQKRVREELSASLAEHVLTELLRGVGVTFEKKPAVKSGQEFAVMTVRSEPGVWHQAMALRK
jgi:hypothetical protein